MLAILSSVARCDGDIASKLSAPTATEYTVVLAARKECTAATIAASAALHGSRTLLTWSTICFKSFKSASLSLSYDPPAVEFKCCDINSA